MKSLLRQITPVPLLALHWRWKLARLRERNRSMSVKEVFTDIYENDRWGGRPGWLRSGTGSTDEHAASYAQVVTRFIVEHGVRSVVDLGCGDFVVGRRLQVDGVRYVGVDIVEELIRRHQQEFGGRDVSFRCLDIIEDPLPEGELCLLRQVLQHLSNDEISRVLPKLRAYRYVLITEHYPAPSPRFVPNRDKPHGMDTRVYDDSAVCLDQPPFNVADPRLILEVDAEAMPLEKSGQKLRTFLVIND